MMAARATTATKKTAAPRTRRAPQDRKPAATEQVAKVHDDGAVTVPWNGGFLTIPPFGQWKTSAMGALGELRFDDWAMSVLDVEGRLAWLEADPTNDEAAAVFTAFEQVAADSMTDQQRRQFDAVRARTRRR